VDIEITLPDFSVIRAYVARRVSRLRNMQVPLERIRDDFYAMERAWFETEGGSQWQALSPRYAAWKAKHYPGKTILRRDDRLFNVVTGQPGDYELRLSELHIRMAGIPYWKAHDEGRGRMPVRRVISQEIGVRKVRWHQWVTEWVRS
jgi:hypothetical protein